MSNTTTYPARYATHTGNHRLVGWGDYLTMRESVLTRIFGYMVQVATPVVKEFHGDLFIDAATLRRFLDDAFLDPSGVMNGVRSMHFTYLVRHSGTNMGDAAARCMFESLAYDAALYMFEVQVDPRGEWHLSIDLLDARPDRPNPDAPGVERFTQRVLGNLPTP